MIIGLKYVKLFLVCFVILATLFTAGCAKKQTVNQTVEKEKQYKKAVEQRNDAYQTLEMEKNLEK